MRALHQPQVWRSKHKRANGTNWCQANAGNSGGVALEYKQGLVNANAKGKDGHSFGGAGHGDADVVLQDAHGAGILGLGRVDTHR